MHYSTYSNDAVQHLNAETGIDLPIKELAAIVAKTLDYTGEIFWGRQQSRRHPEKSSST
jgi:hypothetical protein